jgi:hypothetical protein
MAPPVNPTTSNTVILTNPEDWEPWFTNLQAHVNEEIWPFIDPEQPEIPLQELPIKPKISDIDANATQFHQLSAAQQRVYENSRKFYDSDMKYYNTQSNQLKEARVFITTTVSEMKHIHLIRSDSVREWLVKLKKNTEPTKGQLIQKAVDEYNSALRMKPSGTKVGNWIKQWEYAMTKGERYGIPQLMNGQWLRDLATAIRPLSDVLYNKYMDQADDPEKSMASEYIEVGKKLRQALDHSKGVVPLRTTRGGAFAAEFAGTEESDPDTDKYSLQSRKDRGKPPRSRKRAGTQSIEEETSSSKRSTAQKCPACGIRGHTLPGCWCIFEDQRPEGVSLSESRVKRALKAVKESKELTEQVRKLKLEAERGDMA